MRKAGEDTPANKYKIEIGNLRYLRKYIILKEELDSLVDYGLNTRGTLGSLVP